MFAFAFLRQDMSMLTCLNKKREALLAINSRNVEYLDTISAAVFVICLDDKEATTNVGRVSLTMFGDGFNRWNDKVLQFVIAANGTSS